MNDTQSQSPTTSDDLAQDALNQAQQVPPASVTDELAASDEVAETLSSLQNIIERSATELQQINEDLKQYRESLRNIFENDSELSTAQEQAQQATTQVKERKAKLQGDAQVTQIKVNIGELNERKKEVEESLSNYLVNYYQLTHSTSFDTSDGDQWEFAIKAKVKPRKVSKDDSSS